MISTNKYYPYQNIIKYNPFGKQIGCGCVKGQYGCTKKCYKNCCCNKNKKKKCTKKCKNKCCTGNICSCNGFNILNNPKYNTKDYPLNEYIYWIRNTRILTPNILYNLTNLKN